MMKKDTAVFFVFCIGLYLSAKCSSIHTEERVQCGREEAGEILLTLFDNAAKIRAKIQP